MVKLASRIIRSPNQIIVGFNIFGYGDGPVTPVGPVYGTYG